MMKVKSNLNRVISAIAAIVMMLVMTAIPQGKAHGSDNVSEAELKSMANKLAILINEYRVENGLKPVYVLPHLNDGAFIRAQESIIKFDHYRPNSGEKFSTVVDQEYLPYRKLYENLAAGSDTAEDTFEQWLGSEKHRNIILTENIAYMGTGVAVEEDSEYEWYWQVTFAVTHEETEYADQYLPTEYEIVPKAEGDITGDGYVDVYDYLSLADYLYKKSVNAPVYLNEAQLKSADCFRDGIITEADAKAMMRYILGEYKSLPYIF